MRVVLDTNIVVSGLLWSGAPQRLIHALRANRFTAFASTILVAELAEIIGREQFARRVLAARVLAAELVADYVRLIEIVDPADIAPSVAGDSDDDHLLACALAAGVDLVVTGDKRVRNLKNYQRIRIVSAVEALGMVEAGAPEGKVDGEG